MNWTYILLSYLSLIGLGLADNIRGPVYPELLTQFGLTNSVGSLFFSLNSIFAMLNNMATSYWLKWWGVMKSLRIYSSLLFLATLILGISNRIEFIWIGISIMGLSFGGLAVCQNLLTVHGSSVERRTQSLAGLHTMYGLASFIAPAIVSIGYFLELKWNSAFLIASLVPLGVLLWSFTEKTSPTVHLEHHHKESGSSVGYKALFWVATFTTMYVMSEILVTSRVVLYVRTYESYTPKQANDLLSGFFVALIAGRLLLTFTRLPFKNSTLLRTSLAAAAATMLLAIYVQPIWFIAVGLAMSFSFPCMIAYASEAFGIHTPRAMAWIFTGNYVGLIAMHASVGVMADTLGLQQALLLGPIFLVCGVILLSKKPLLPERDA